MVLSDEISIVNIVVTGLSTLFSPLIALWIGGILQVRAKKQSQKLEILSILLSMRFQPLSPEAIRSLNLIDVVFCDDYKVREAWSNYFTSLNQNITDITGNAYREEKKRDLILAMVEASGLKNKINTSDILRSYSPNGVTRQIELEGLETEVRYVEASRKLRQFQNSNIFQKILLFISRKFTFSS